MIEDARTLLPGAVLTADLCIVGGGPAGLTLAAEFDGRGQSVLLLEAGGRAFDPGRDDELRGELADGGPHAPTHLFRRWMLGGASAVWGGRCVPLDPIDLERRPWVPRSGWPIPWSALRAHYPEALRRCEAGRFAFDVRGALGEAAPPFLEGLGDPDLDAEGLERFSRPTDFGKASTPWLAASANVRVLLHARALRLHTRDGAGPVQWLEAASRPGRGFSVRARRYVLAVGGLEVPRLLLHSDPTRRGGLGNDGGAVGRFYQCHAENTLARLRLPPGAPPPALGFVRTDEGVYTRRRLALSAGAQRRERLLNTVFRLHHPLIADPAHGVGVLSAMFLLKGTLIPEFRRKLSTVEAEARTAQRRDARFWLAHAGNIARDAPAVLGFARMWTLRRGLARRKLPFVVVASRDNSYPLDVNAEQVPDRDSRVSLSRDLDAYGVPRLRVDWRLHDRDADSLLRGLHVLRAALDRSGVGRLEFDDAAAAERVRRSVPVGGHHIGTARMSDGAHEGVVDANGAVHGVPNLFVAGAAVFPTSGHANPTLTVVALSLRLAAHLARLATLDRLGAASPTAPASAPAPVAGRAIAPTPAAP